VARAKAGLQAASVYDRDSLRREAQIIGRGLATGQTIDDIEAWPERIAAVTTRHVNDAARAVLVDDIAVTSLLRPAPQSLARTP
jgi:zinc protease